MLGNYKKIAIINTSGHYLKSKETTIIPININFEPKRIIITTNRPTKLSIDSNNGLYVEFGGRVFLDIWSSQIEFNTKTVSIRSNHLGTRDIEVSEIIALG